jgi:hypothetical protein
MSGRLSFFPSNNYNAVVYLIFVFVFPEFHWPWKDHGAWSCAASGFHWHPAVCISEYKHSLYILHCFHSLLYLQIPNPLFDLAGITCGHFLVPFWTFFGATLIGKAVIKMHIQVGISRACWILWQSTLSLSTEIVCHLCVQRTPCWGSSQPH